MSTCSTRINGETRYAGSEKNVFGGAARAHSAAAARARGAAAAAAHAGAAPGNILLLVHQLGLHIITCYKNIPCQSKLI